MLKNVISSLPSYAGLAAGAAYMVSRNRYINRLFSSNSNNPSNTTMVPVNTLRRFRTNSAVGFRNYPYTTRPRRRYTRRYRYRFYKSIKTSNSFTFDFITRFNVGELQQLASSGNFLASYSLSSVLYNSINWDSVSPLWNMVRLSYIKIYCRTLLSSKYFKNHPCIAIGLFPSSSSLLTSYESVLSSNGSCVWQTDKSYYWGKFNLYKYASSNLPGVGRFLALDHTNSHNLPTTAFPLMFSLYLNTPFSFDITRGTSATDDDVGQYSPVIELYFKLWVRFKDPNV